MSYSKSQYSLDVAEGGTVTGSEARVPVRVVATPDENGGCDLMMLMPSDRFPTSYMSPAPPRIAVLPLPSTFQAKPRRGPMLYFVGLWAKSGPTVGVASVR